MNEQFWEKVYEKAEMNRLFIQLLKEVIPSYLELLSVLK